MDLFNFSGGGKEPEPMAGGRRSRRRHSRRN